MKHILHLLLCLPCIIWSQTQLGQDIDGEAVLNLSGSSTALSLDGNIVAIGARFNDGNGFNSGHVRIYENMNGTWIQLGQDIDGEASFDISGFSVSLSSNGKTVAIGAIGNDTNRGHVRVYENIGGTWTQLGQDIDGENAGDRFGYSVSLSSNGNIVAIGTENNSDNGNLSGHVRIYENMNGTWIQLGQDIDGEAALTRLGRMVSLSLNGNIVAIGATGVNNSTGYTRVYENIGGSWTQIGQDIDGENPGDQSGYGVSLSSNGNIVAIGSIGNDGNGNNSGQVRIFENLGGVWSQIGNSIYGDAPEDKLGEPVSLSSDGSIVAVSAVGNDNNGNNSGHVRVYQNQGGTWTQLGNDIEGEAVDDESGYRISLSSDGTRLAIGATGNDGNGNNSGHVRVFDFSSLLSVNEFIISSFNLYPNPTTNQFTIQLNNTSELEQVTIYNLLGQSVLNTKHSIVNTSTLGSGSYIVEVKTNKGTSSKKLIIE